MTNKYTLNGGAATSNKMLLARARDVLAKTTCPAPITCPPPVTCPVPVTCPPPVACPDFSQNSSCSTVIDNYIKLIDPTESESNRLSAKQNFDASCAPNATQCRSECDSLKSLAIRTARNQFLPRMFSGTGVSFKDNAVSGSILSSICPPGNSNTECQLINNNLYKFPNTNGVSIDKAIYMGCYSDNGTTRHIPTWANSTPNNTPFTPQSCFTMCRDRGYDVAGLQNGSACMCGHKADVLAYTGAGGKTQSCNKNCAGDAQYKCGDYYANSVYLLA